MEHNLITSASGWRKVFAESGDCNDTTPDIGKENRIIAALVADTFADYIIARNATPYIVFGIDSRPTGPMIADTMLKIFIAKKIAVSYAGIIAAPEIMAYSRTADAFVYISASHNPIGYNGIKFGLNDGGVLSAEENARLVEGFNRRINSEEAINYVHELYQKCPEVDLDWVYTEASAVMHEASSIYRSFAKTTIAGTDDITKQNKLFAEIRKQVLGVEHPQYNTSLNNVAVYNSNLGNFTEALKIGNEVTKVAKKIYGTEHPEYATRLFNLANYYSDQGNYIQAIRLCNMAMDILYKAFGSEHPYYAAVLSHLANCNAILGRYKKALYFGKKAMEIRQKIYGSEHPKYGFSLIDLACLYISTGDYVEAHNYLKQYIDYSQSYILNNFIELSSNLRKSLWTKEYASFYINVFPGFVEKYKNKESISELYNKTCLFAKGILLNTDMEIRNLILESSDSLLISKYNHLYSNLCIYNKLLEIPINKRLLNADSLNNVIQSQEMELAKESKVYGDYTHNLTINWKDVQRRLGDNDIAIEFLDFPIYGTDSTMYVALTLKKDYDSPHMVTLFEEKQLKSIPENAYYTQTDASDLIWKPL